MSQEVSLRIVFSAIYALVLGFIVLSRQSEEQGEELPSRYSGRRYRPYIACTLLPFGLTAMGVALVIMEGPEEAARLTLSMCFGVFLHIGFYYMLLLPLLPLLRRHLSARACAMLWMIPNYLYFTVQPAMELPGPGLVVYAPEVLVWALFVLWLAGMAVVLIWKTAEHLMFRRRILAGAEEVTDPEMLAVWERCLERSGFHSPKFRLVTSQRVAAPLSVGLFFRTIRVVLPRRSYRAQELELILRHELVHIGREDGWSKFFLVFCTAVCWFNPLMWVAMSKSAQDIELSCDETVLLGEDEAVRRQYARLLLDTAGDERGFTTCLSAAARTMHHRLKCVVAPRRRSAGALAVALVFFLLCSTSGYVALAYEQGTGADFIRPAGGWEGYSLRESSIHLQEDAFDTTYDIADEQGFFQYLSGLPLYRITGNYAYSQVGRRLNFSIEGPENVRMISLCDRAVKVTVYRNSRDHDTVWYHLPDGVDWEQVHRLIVPRPAMNVALYRQGDPYATDYPARLEQLWKTGNGGQVILYQPQEEYGAGVYSSQRFQRAQLTFSQIPAGECTVQIHAWDYSRSRTVTRTDQSGPFELELPDEPVHCTVTAGFRGPDGEVHWARFGFDVGEI